jgi:hypothetical protein
VLALTTNRGRNTLNCACTYKCPCRNAQGEHVPMTTRSDVLLAVAVSVSLAHTLLPA